jgi:hypothetical protein
MSALPPPTLHIFVSHSHDDDQWSRSFAEAVRAEGFDVFYDATHIQGSDAWVASIQRELGRCDVFVVILTPASVASPWVQREIQLALAANKRILPIVHKRLSTKEIDEVGFLRIYQWVDSVGEDSQTSRRCRAWQPGD